MSKKRKPLIVGINGGPHMKCRTVTILTEALQAARDEGARTKLVHLKDHVRTHFDGRRNCNGIPKPLGKLFGLLLRSQGMIIATPTYWFMPTDRVMTFLCYLSVFEAPDFDLKGMTAGCIAVCEEDGGQAAAESMGRVLQHMGMALVPFGSFFRNRNMAGRSEHGWQTKDHRLVGRNVVRLAKKMSKGAKLDWNGH
jgi:multimeric flavodoxin WrbA